MIGLPTAGHREPICGAVVGRETSSTEVVHQGDRLVPLRALKLLWVAVRAERWHGWGGVWRGHAR